MIRSRNSESTRWSRCWSKWVIQLRPWMPSKRPSYCRIFFSRSLRLSLIFRKRNCRRWFTTSSWAFSGNPCRRRTWMAGRRSSSNTRQRKLKGTTVSHNKPRWAQILLKALKIEERASIRENLTMWGLVWDRVDPEIPTLRAHNLWRVGAMPSLSWMSRRAPQAFPQSCSSRPPWEAPFKMLMTPQQTQAATPIPRSKSSKSSFYAWIHPCTTLSTWDWAWGSEL